MSLGERKSVLGWLGGIRGLRETIRLQDAYRNRVEFAGRSVHLPPDSPVVGQVPPADREQETEKAIPLPAIERDPALQASQVLQPDGRSTNWEHWCRLFETELSGRHVPRESWLDMLVTESSLGMRQEAMSVIEGMRLTSVAMDIVHEAVRDMLLGNAGVNYHAPT